MFDIEYKGANSVVISTKKDQLVIDPKLSLVGLSDLNVKGAIQLATEDRFVVNDPSVKLTIEGPGEYEVSDFSIRGFAATRHIDTKEDEKKTTVYRIDISDIKIAVLGNVSPDPSEEQLEELGVIDILILPVGGGGYTLDATSAAATARQIEAKVVIPVHYADNSLKYEVPQDTLDTFISELGGERETVAKYKVKSTAALPQVLTIVELTRTS